MCPAARVARRADRLAWICLENKALGWFARFRDRANQLLLP
jgi:hypothetical protein